MKDILNEYDINKAKNVIDDIDPDTLGGDFEIPEDLSKYQEDTNISMAVAAINIGGGLSIVDNLTNVNYSNRYNPKKFIVIHYTAGSVDDGTAAKANTNYFKSTNRGASANFFVDMNPIIYRCVDENLVAWHCGTTGAYYHNSCRNSNSIGIEICSYKENGVYKFKDATIQNAIKLTKYLADKYNIPRSNIVMHWHVTHKICAAPFITNGKPNQRWDNFLNAVFGDDEYAPIDVVEIYEKGKVVNINNSVLNRRSGPGTNYGIIGNFNEGDILSITGQNGDWYEVDNNGFVHSNYIKLIDGWCDDIRDELLNMKVITDKDEWSRYSESTTKALAVQLVSNATDILLKNENNNINIDNQNNHWATEALNNLASKGIVTDYSQWNDSLDEYISKALYMALVCNMLGGVSDIYKDRKLDHWGRNCLDTLCDKEVITDPKQWDDFESQINKELALAMIYKAIKNK